jgi:nucleoside-diphosphate-sugar epimerase
VRALVTGAAGFVGSHLADALLARGDTVVGVDCFTPYYARETKQQNLSAAITQPHFELVEADLRATDIEPLLDGVDVVFHQAQRLLEAVVVARPSARVVYASSSSVYGNQARYPAQEADLPAPFSPYGVTKLAAEHLCALYAANAGLHTVSLRYFTVYGPRQRPDMSIHRLCDAAVNGTAFPRYGDGRQVREFTYVDDIVRANVLAAEREVEPGFVANVAGGAEITLTDLIALVGELAGAPVKVEEQPAQPGDTARNGGAIDRARAALGWEPKVALRDGIAAQLAAQRAS